MLKKKKNYILGTKEFYNYQQKHFIRSSKIRLTGVVVSTVAKASVEFPLKGFLSACAGFLLTDYHGRTSSVPEGAARHYRETQSRGEEIAKSAEETKKILFEKLAENNSKLSKAKLPEEISR